MPRCGGSLQQLAEEGRGEAEERLGTPLKYLVSSSVKMVSVWQ